ILLRRERWNDYGERVTYRVWLCTEDGAIVEVGTTKILGPMGASDIPTRFTSLDASHVSLGQEARFYEVLDEWGLRSEVLTALRDLTVWPSDAEVPVDDAALARSLLRFEEARLLLESARRS